MICINEYCRSKPNTEVIDSRYVEKYKYVRRRRECPRCKQRFTTHEVVENAKLSETTKNAERKIQNIREFAETILEKLDSQKYD